MNQAKLLEMTAALPDLNPDIADPARHEKILSFLAQQCDLPQTVTFLLDQANALESISVLHFYHLYSLENSCSQLGLSRFITCDSILELAGRT